MIVSINQPAYLAWLGHFERIAMSDLHVVLDDVQFPKNDTVNRNRVRCRGSTTGWQWLTVPVRKVHMKPLNQVEVNNDAAWGRKHWRTLEQEYGSEPRFGEFAPFWEETLNWSWPKLVHLIEVTMLWTLRELEVKTPMLKSSQLHGTGRKSELMLSLCHEVGATVYLSGPYGREYLDEERFAEEGIEVRYHDYEPPSQDVIEGWGLPALHAMLQRRPAFRRSL